ncbi:MAG: hypothetical protein AAGA34_01410 [Pseudomonadota bacterium]
MLNGIIFVVLGGGVLYHVAHLLRGWRLRMNASEPPMPLVERLPIFAAIGGVNLLALAMILWGVIKIFQ